jgi:aldehyde:ferredoxin oxidoreductase
MIIEALNNALGTNLPQNFLRTLGRETLELEDKFNEAAGFTKDDDKLPDFFYKEDLPPTKNFARHRANEVNKYKHAWIARGES